jgi:C4-dicarboxylate-specific signal transduction histidine kinase
MEYRLLQPDGTVRWVSARGRCVDADDGTGPKLFGVSMDVTARKQAEARAAQQSEELQQKRVALEHVARVATLGELTATLTHELKQPLNAIVSGSALAVRFLDEPAPNLQEVRESLVDIADIARRAGNMIQGMRDMLRRDTPGFARVDLNHVIRTLEHIVHSDAVSHRVTVQLDLPAASLPVTGDTIQLQQVMLNLMLNAFGAMRGPEITLRRLIVRARLVDGSSVLIEAHDTGTGIPAEKLESIFDPFTTSKPDGLGMGLSICRSIIERHGGKIWASNNQDRGATLSIMLPATRE